MIIDDEPIELTCERCGASIIRYHWQPSKHCLKCDLERIQKGN